MDPCFFDYSKSTDAVSIFIKDHVVLPAGAGVYAMPVSDRNDRYKQLADLYDVHFIFSDNVPSVDFYAVPYLSIFAYDSSGGMFASVGAFADFESDAKIAYISPDRTVFLAADNGRAFILNLPSWKENLRLYSGAELFSDLEHAKEKYQFLDIEQLQKKRDSI